MDGVSIIVSGTRSWEKYEGILIRGKSRGVLSRNESVPTNQSNWTSMYDCLLLPLHENLFLKIT